MVALRSSARGRSTSAWRPPAKMRWWASTTASSKLLPAPHHLRRQLWPHDGRHASRRARFEGAPALLRLVCRDSRWHRSLRLLRPCGRPRVRAAQGVGGARSSGRTLLGPHKGQTRVSRIPRLVPELLTDLALFGTYYKISCSSGQVERSRAAGGPGIRHRFRARLVRQRPPRPCAVELVSDVLPADPPVMVGAGPGKTSSGPPRSPQNGGQTVRSRHH